MDEKPQFQSAIRQLDHLKTWACRGEHAPHKPLLVLYALGRWENETLEWIPFSDVDRDLSALLDEFGPERQSYHPEYPFWRLQHDGVWRVEADGPLEIRQSNTDPKKSELIRHNARGAFSVEIVSYLRTNPNQLKQIASSILSEHFPVSTHDAILAARFGRPRQEYKQFAFRVFWVFNNAERRNNAAATFLSANPPILSQAWLSTYEEVMSNPLGSIWIRPRDYYEAVRGTPYEPTGGGSPQGLYKRQSLREQHVEAVIRKHGIADSQ